MRHCALVGVGDGNRFACADSAAECVLVADPDPLLPSHQPAFAVNHEMGTGNMRWGQAKYDEPIKSPESVTSVQNGSVNKVIYCGNDHFSGCQVSDQNAYFVQTQAGVSCETIPRSVFHYGESLVSYSKVV
jgi:hypothetical protein